MVAEKKACDAKKKKEAEYAKEDADYGYDKEGKSLNPKDKKEEEKKDMRGYYAKINVVKNKLRAMGAKNPCVIADPDDVEKTWDKSKKKDDDVKEEKTENSPLHKPGEPNSQYEKDGTPKKKKKEKESEERYNPFTKDGKTRPGDKTPTSASETTGP